MKKQLSTLMTIAALALTSTLNSKAATQVYDLKADWSDTQNPNGAWSYLAGGNFLLSANPFPWSIYDFDYIKRATAADVVPGVLELGDITSKAEQSQISVRWTSPASGAVDISAAMWEADDDPITGSNRPWAVIKNGIVIGSDPIGLIGNRTAPTELSLLNVPIEAGDRIELFFELGAGPNGLNFTIALTPDAIDPVGAIQNLALTVIQMNLQNGIANSLDTKLDTALNALEDASLNNDGAACNSLSAFTSAVEAQRDKNITGAQANQLIAAAQEIKAMLNCGN